MKKELLEKLKSAKSREELSELFHTLPKPAAKGAQELSKEDLDGVAGGADQDKTDYLEFILAVYDCFGPDMTIIMLKSELGVPGEYINTMLKRYTDPRDAVEACAREYLGL